MSLRSPLGRVTGLGSAKEGTGHWWSQRVTSVALVPLMLWFLISVLGLPSWDYETFRAWASVPLCGFLSVLLVAVAAYHSYLGTMVIVEDYLSAPAGKVVTLMLLRFAHVLCAGAGIFAILRLSFGSPQL